MMKIKLYLCRLKKYTLYTTDEHLSKYDIIEVDGYSIVSVDEMEFED